MTSPLRTSRASGPAALVVALLALIVAMTGTSYAAVSLAKNSVGTKQLRSNAVTTVKVKDHSLTAADFAAGQLPAAAKGDPGPKGDTGAKGATGAAGTPGTVRGWAQIDSTGAVVRSGGAYPVATANVGHGSTGSYTIFAPGWGTGASPQTFAATLIGNTGFIVANPSFSLFGSSIPASVSIRSADGSPLDSGFVILLP